MTAAAEPGGTANDLLRRILPVLANATVLTAMLVYFGWQRSEIQARELGIDESILGMDTREYVLRSVRPVLVLVLGIGVAGLLWLRTDAWLTTRAKAHGTTDRAVRYALRVFPYGWLVLPAAVLALGALDARSATLFVLFPFSIGAGVLLVLYAATLRAQLPGAAPPPGQDLARAFTAVVVGVALFWGTSNYAEVEGRALAATFDPRDRPRVVVYSAERLQLTAPGVREEEVGEDGDQARYRYDGLRLLEHTGGRYFLVSDRWTKDSGAVMMLTDKDTVQLEFRPPAGK